MQLTSIISRFSDRLATVYPYHLPIPDAVAVQFAEKDNKRVICTLNDQEKIRSGLMPYAGYHYLIVSKAIVEKLGLKYGSEVGLTIQKDTSDLGMDFPIELEEVLAQDDGARFFFQKLTPGKQRNLIYIVNSVKNTNSRLNKAMAIAKHLTSNNGHLDFKLLNAVIKEYNQQGKLSKI